MQDAHESAGEEIDREAYRRVTADIRQAMAKLEQVRSQHQAAINSITKAAGVINDLDEAVLAGLRKLDEVMCA